MVAEDGQPQELRARAFKGLGDVLMKAGEKAAAQAAWLQATRLGHPHVPMPESTRTNGNVAAGDDDLLKAKVTLLIAQYRGQLPDAEGELRWIGKPAVDHLIETIRVETDTSFVTRAVTLALSIDPEHALPKLAAIAGEQDVLRRRAILRGLHQPLLQEHRPLAARELGRFLKDEHLQVRVDAAIRLATVLPLTEVLALLPDLTETQQAPVLAAINAGWTEVQHAPGHRDAFRLMLPWLERSSMENYRLTSSSLSHALGADYGYFEDSLAGRRLFLQVIQSPCMRAVKIGHGPWPLPAGLDTHGPLLMQEILATAAALGDSRTSTEAHKNLARFADPVMLGWDRSNVVDVLKLFGTFGYRRLGDTNVETWIANHMDASHIVQISNLLADTRASSHDLLTEFLKHGVPAEAFPGLQAFAEQQIRDKQDRTAGATCEAIMASGSADAIDYLLSLMPRRMQPGCRRWADHASYVLGRSAGATPERVQLQLLTYDDRQLGPGVREAGAMAAVRAASKQAIPLYAKAYELGLHPRVVLRSVQRADPLVGLIFDTSDEQWRAYQDNSAAPEWTARSNAYDDATAAQIFDRCLATGVMRAFVEATACLDSRQPLAEVVLAAIVRHLPSFPEQVTVGKTTCPLRLTAMKALFESYDAPEIILPWVREALTGKHDKVLVQLIGALQARHLQDDASFRKLLTLVEATDLEVAVSAISCLATHRPQEFRNRAEDWIATLEAPHARRQVGREYLRIRGADAIPTVGRLLDGSAETWTLLMEVAATHDVRAIPFLIEMYQSPIPNATGREAIKSALESIRFFHEQRRLWDGIGRNSELSHANAAEALIQQCKSSDKIVRSTAIRSLGTLGVTETLPFLIRLMSDPDPAIAALAKASADQINAKADAARKQD